MFLLGHYYIPVALGRAWDLSSGMHSPISRWGYAAVGLAGIMPDLLCPHIYLAERYSSWTHTLIGALFGVILLGVPKKLFRWCGAAILLHLLCDGICGGIAPFYPWDTTTIWGAYWIPSEYWLCIEIPVALVAWIMGWVLKQRAQRLVKHEQIPSPSSLD